MQPRSIKARIIMLVLVSAIPGLIVIGILGMKNREHVRSQAKLELERVVQLLGHENETLIVGINQVLSTLSHSPDIMQTPAATRLLKKVQNENTAYANIYVVNSAGSIIASALPIARIDLSDRMLAIYGVTRAEAASMSIIEDYSPPGTYAEWLSDTWKQVLRGRAHHFEWQARRPHDGSLFDVEVFLNRITLNGEYCILATARDITDQKRSEERLRDSLNEKEVLLKEIHHRVKNNLQIISSLLSLQSAYIKDGNMVEIFRDSQTRVRTMALVHQKLYQSDNLASIDFRDYAAELVRDLFRFYGAMANNIQYAIDSDETFLDIDIMVPAGLIISELISNSIKHAFPDKRGGTISVDFRSNENGITLTVADDGTGLPEGLDIKNTESLGLQLVMTLIEQLEGRLDLVNDGGTRITMTMRGT